MGREGFETEANCLSVASELERLCALSLSVICCFSSGVKVERALPVALTVAVAEGGQALLEYGP